MRRADTVKMWIAIQMCSLKGSGSTAPFHFVRKCECSLSIQFILGRVEWERMPLEWDTSLAMMLPTLHCMWKKMLDMKGMFVFKHIDQKSFCNDKIHFKFLLFLS